MSYTIQQGGRLDYNYKEIVINREVDVETVPTHSACPGSIIYVIENGNIYMLNENKEWIEQ